MKNLSKHAEWLSLIEISGPFLTVSMLDKAFPQGLEAVETPRRQKLRAAYEEWREAVDQEDRLLPKLHREWIRLVLTEILEYDQESLVHADDWSDELPSISSQEHTGTFRPDWIVRSPIDQKSRLFIAVLPPETDLESVLRGDGWPVSLQDRMTLLCRAHGVRVGLLTDGERWMLVNAPVGSLSSQASWYARLWSQEPITLKAFHSLLGVRRCFGPAEDTLESLLDESLHHHEEITDTLGEQVRRAVEVLVQCLDKADEDRNRELLRDVTPSELYEAGLTVMMRLVFVLCAEERGLLLLGDSVYDRCYAVSTLRGQLAEEAARHGPEVLDRRHDAWARLLAVFRAVYGGIEHESLRMPALGGSLFDPDRFPFLEGRAKGSCWRNTSAAPLPIDNRTVLLLLNSLQILEQSGGALLLSYRALDVEQIGHVYEGLLEHTAARVPHVTLGLRGSQKAKNPNVALAELESACLAGESAITKLLEDTTGRSTPALKKALSKPAEDTIFGRVRSVCGGDRELAERIRPFTNLLRTDAWDDPIVYRDNSFMVTLGADRRETGTHYTPKSLTESIVTTTLEPIVYIGPAEGKPREEWTLKSSREILDLKVCDPAMGSGAFLVQACRYLGEKLVETWLHEEAAGKAITVDGEALDQLEAEEPLPSQLDERLTIARRLVAERCLYGVDINPLAVELAKLSIWLVTLAKDRPFGFLDHSFCIGDSLLGVHDLEQLLYLNMKPGKGSSRKLFSKEIKQDIETVIAVRGDIRSRPIRDIHDVQAMAAMDEDARAKLELPVLIADALIGEVLTANGKNPNTTSLAVVAGNAIAGQAYAIAAMKRRARVGLAKDVTDGKHIRRPFHWPLEFPEVFNGPKSGFDAMVGNPPFLGGQKITGAMGTVYREYLVEQLAGGTRGSADLVSYFFLTAFSLLAKDGLFGLLAVNTIAEGNTREVGLDRILTQGGVIVAAYPSEVWPGTANVVTSRVHLVNGAWQGVCTLAGKSVSRISSYLGTLESWAPVKLRTNLGLVFQGNITLGEGFLVDEDFARSAIAEDPDYRKIIYPYLIGREVNQSPKHLPGRLVINFFDWPESKAAGFPLAYNKVVHDVKPEREKQKDKGAKRQWWLHLRPRPELYHATGRGALFSSHPSGWKSDSVRLERVIVFATGATKYPCFTLVPNKYICANTVCVVASDSYALLACLSSDFHVVWAWEHGSKMKQDLRYTHGDIFETFPFPDGVLSGDAEELATLGEQFFDARRAYMVANNKGMTKFYNDFHDPDCDNAAIVACRNLQKQIDDAVLAAYELDDIDLDISFHEVPYLPENDRVRFTISEPARVEVLHRLSELNRQRYKDEVDKGLHGNATSPISPVSKKGRIRSSKAESFGLFDFAASETVTGNKACKVVLNHLSETNAWLAKDDILTGSGIPANQWQSTIKQLLADGLVERQGERRGARYRAVKNGGKQL